MLPSDLFFLPRSLLTTGHTFTWVDNLVWEKKGESFTPPFYFEEGLNLKLYSKTKKCCYTCKYFRNDPEYLEEVFPGYKVLSSAYGSTRKDDGICLLKEIYLSGYNVCKDYVPKNSSWVLSSFSPVCFIAGDGFSLRLPLFVMEDVFIVLTGFIPLLGDLYISVLKNFLLC